MEIHKISDMLEEMIPIWKDFIVELGYSEEQGCLFAKGYSEKTKKLPIAAKLQALSTQYQPCMSAGFKEANIDEKEAFNKYKEINK